jgi:2-dehydro-3-deoxyphosphogluconate aldolase/(4S)-4-hydroxy-2-oxoglutarate aldolase
MRERIIERIMKRKIIAIVRGIEAENNLRVAKALYEGGIDLVEVTFNQSKPKDFGRTASAIRAIVEYFGDKVLAGAGTVTTPALVEMAMAAGAGYIVSPDTNPRVIQKTRELDLVSIPGAMTPTEILTAHESGADFVKLFPAGNLGLSYLKAVKAPLSHVRLVATGGVNEKNIREFLDAGAVGAGIGGNLVSKAWIDAGDFDKITAAARECVAASQASRG